MTTATPVAAQEKLASQSVETLQDMARTLMNQYGDGTDVVFGWVLEELEARMAEKSFCEFCESLD